MPDFLRINGQQMARLFRDLRLVDAHASDVGVFWHFAGGIALSLIDGETDFRLSVVGVQDVAALVSGSLGAEVDRGR